ncbi:MAG: hypothetical protein GQ562_11040 [Anaerolineales bacterium]|nr:hypothetical protein [Anaerolineales bacterium]
MTHHKNSRFFILVLICVAFLLGACDNSSPTQQPIQITVGCDVTSLIAAINQANNSPGPEIINLGYCVYTLTEVDNSSSVDGITIHNGFPVITSEITIMGNSAVIEIQKDPGEPDFGHFFVEADGDLELYNLMLSDGIRPLGGAVVNKGGDFFASNVVFKDNTADSKEPGEMSLGGAIYSTDGRVRLIDHCQFQENVTVNNGIQGANHGGAIYNKNSGLLLSNSSFLWNEADGDGGAIYSLKNSANDEGAAIQISDTHFRESVADQNGGAIAFIGDFDAIIIATSYFGQNQAGNYGGAIYSEGSGVIANYTDFRGNTASYGGAIYTKRNNAGDSSKYNSEHANYDYNSASESGGAIFSENADLELNEDHFADNSAASCGAIRNGGSPDLDVEAGDLGTAPFVNSSSEITMSNFGQNLATVSHGGAICHFMGEMYIGDTIFSLNESPAFGGAVLLMDNAELFGSAFLSNYAQNGAGLMIGLPVFNHHSTDSSISYLDFQSSIDKCWFSTNRADAHGGGIYAHHKGLVTITRTTLIANSAYNYGGGIYQGEGDLVIHNSTISGNSAFRGAGLYTAGEGTPVPELELNHTTVAYNIAQDTSSSSRAGGGGLNINGNVISENSLVVENMPDDCAQGQNLNSSLSQNVDSDQTCGFWQTIPNPKLGPANGNTHPVLSGSPLIDLLPVCGLAEDQMGTSRPQGAGCEPGSYEYDPSNPPAFPIPDDPPGDTADNCNPFENMDISVVLLSVPADTLVLPLYLKIPGGVPGMEGSELWDYRALLGEIESYKCGLQGFPDRLYCLFNLPPEALGLALDLKLFIGNCEDPAYYQPKVTIPLPQCKADLDEEACKVAGGTWKRPVTGGDYYCDCP